MTPSTCSRCSVHLSGDIAHGLCPACLLEAGLAADSAEDRAGAAGSRQFGPYELIGELGRGGQAVVYRARHTALNREVALKMLPVQPWTTPEGLSRFRQEARVAAELDHPAIVPIHDVGEIDGQHFFTMKLIDGVTADRLVAQGDFTPRRAAGIIAEVARALQHAHERGVLHRDIKPGNLLIDAAGRPHLTDFGLAKHQAAEGQLTRSLERLGTPSYVSPEMVAGDAARVSPATDVYGLGAVLYHLLTGHPPFAGGTALDALRQVLDAEPRAPRAWQPGLDRELETICLKCLEKEPARRYATAGELADDLERWRQHRPIRARPGGLAWRGWKWLRRNIVVATAASAVIVCAVGAAWSAQRARAAARPPYTLAVLLRPADAESRYLAAEFSRNLIHLLGGLPSARVAPRAEVLKWETSSEPVAHAARALRTASLLAGSVRRSGERFQLSLELTEAASGRRLWTRTIEAPLAAGADQQIQAVRAIAAQLGLELTGRNRSELRIRLTADPDAWLHYLRGRQLLDAPAEAALLEAVTAFEQAIARDPGFAQAYAGLADAHVELGYTFREPAAHFARARTYVREALARDETLPDALVAEGVLNYFLEWNWAAAESSLRRAVLLDPSKLENHACYLHCLETVGRVDEALALVRAAAEAQPSSVMIQAELGCASYYAGRYDDAAHYLRGILRKDPGNVFVQWSLARTLAQQGSLAEAVAILEAVRRKPGGDWAAIAAELAYVQARAGRPNEARPLLEELRDRSTREFVDPYLLAMAHAGLGETDEVFRQLERAATVRSSWIPSLPLDPKFAPLRGDPRFGNLLGTLKLGR